MFKAALSFQLYDPSRDFSSAFVNVQVSQPYSNIDSTVDVNSLIFDFRGSVDFQTFHILLQAAQARALHTLTSWVELPIYDPRYLNSSTFLMISSLLALISKSFS